MAAVPQGALNLRDSSLFCQQAFVGGRWVQAAGNAVKQVFNPANGRLIGTVPNCGALEAREAIEAANKQLPHWRARTAKDRAQLLRKWFDLILANQEDLAVLMTIEQGKPLVESRGEIASAAAFIEWFAEEGKRAYGDVIPTHATDKRLLVLKQSIGVTAAITPWNFPTAMIARKLGPALAAGCTMVIKPSELTPFSALALCVLAERAGLPPGVVSVVTGDPEPIGGEFTSNPLVRKVSFTGSTAVGKLLMSQCAGTVKRVSLELGGNAPFIVFDDADLDAAINGVIASKYRNAGQTCVCANRIYVQSGIYERFAERLADRVSRMKIGDGLESGTVIGPLIGEQAVAKVEQHVRDAVSKGATTLVGGKRFECDGYFYMPTVLTGVKSDMLVMREEIFGPVAPLVKFETEAEVIALANSTEFGLASYFYSRDISRVWRVAEALESGMVGINEGIISTEVAPFGGVKQSGIGREGSRYGIEDYLEIKYLCIGGVSG
ncbi:NAD-dependent succinate-semialdehyde dehydrogenase [Peristeroidobacter soli]|uniref:NAD-dependent succinate-semialdehyde dehydrogenase n=1 Tax=Peristeroidobacter soli TaxID=2497877 RepID=UPI00101DDACA|nr:NAD-dependent succinate-semialdehyde dehydrogenase [Peristeroidobacter soli]